MTLAQSIRLAFPILLSCTLVACGGGGGFTPDNTSANPGTDTTGGTTPAGTTAGTTTTGTAVSSLRLSASSYQLESDGTIPVTISAVAKDANNVLISDAEIIISVDSDADLTATTGAAIKTATLSPGIAKNRALKVTARSGTQVQEIIVNVVGTKTTVEGPQRIQFNVPTKYIMSVRNSGSKPVAYIDVSPPQVTTGSCTTDLPATGNKLDSAGNLTFHVTGTKGEVCIVSADNLGSSSTLEIEVSGDEFTMAATSDMANDVPNGDDSVVEVKLGTSEKIELQLKKNGQPLKLQDIALNTTRGMLDKSLVTTDANGYASFNISSATSGQAVIKASFGELTTELSNLEFVAIAPHYISTQASPAIVTPLGKSIITSRVLDINNNPVKNQIVEFNLDDVVFGKLNDSSAKTNSLGLASIEYTAGDTASAFDGVRISSTVQSSTTVNDEVKLTVGGKALRMVIGTDRTLQTVGVKYKQRFVVTVSDSAGNPIKDQDVSVSIVPTHYYKGKMAVVGEGWAAVSTVNTIPDPKDATKELQITTPPVSCLSEDRNNNGYLEDLEDINHNNQLEPTHDAIVKAEVVGSKTGEDGSLSIEVEYPKSSALWSRQKLIVRTAVGGTEYSESTEFTLEVLYDDVQDIKVNPPNKYSPYGQALQCSDAS